jgi:hypothetical protein
MHSYTSTPHTSSLCGVYYAYGLRLCLSLPSVRMAGVQAGVRIGYVKKCKTETLPLKPTCSVVGTAEKVKLVCGG